MRLHILLGGIRAMHGLGENKTSLNEHLAMLYSLMLKGKYKQWGMIKLRCDVYDVLAGNTLRDEWRGAWINLYEFIKEYGVL